MKKKMIYLFLLACMAAFTVSCSQSEDLLPAEDVATRADSPFFTTFPDELYHTIGSPVQEVELRILNLGLITVLRSFDMVIQGPDADLFIAYRPQVGLVEFLNALKDEGTGITTEYLATSGGPHEAELLITASFLGLLMPVQTTVPLYGVVEDPYFEITPSELHFTRNGEEQALNVRLRGVPSSFAVGSYAYGFRGGDAFEFDVTPLRSSLNYTSRGYEEYLNVLVSTQGITIDPSFTPLRPGFYATEFFINIQSADATVNVEGSIPVTGVSEDAV